MDYKIPQPGHRITLEHDGALNGTDEGFVQGQEQNQQIIQLAQALAKELGTEEQYLSIEVWYKRTDIDAETTENDFDAVQVDVLNGTVVGTLPPYSEIDPKWWEVRYVVDVAD